MGQSPTPTATSSKTSTPHEQPPAAFDNSFDHIGMLEQASLGQKA
jgi:hypothetical protein